MPSGRGLATDARLWRESLAQSLPKGHSLIGSYPLSVQYVVNDQGQPVQVLLDIADYEELLERIEDTDAIRMLEGMKQSSREYISFDDLTTSLGVHV